MDRHNIQKCESLVILQFISSEFWEEEKKNTFPTWHEKARHFIKILYIICKTC